MKKINNFNVCFLTFIILSLVFYSCSNESEIGMEQNKTQLNKADLGVTSVKIDNGIASDGNNILVFENEEYLVKNFERLISDHEIYNENLDKIIPLELEDDELDNYMLKNNLNEDFVLDEFEKKIRFYFIKKNY